MLGGSVKKGGYQNVGRECEKRCGRDDDLNWEGGYRNVGRECEKRRGRDDDFNWEGGY